MDLEVRLEKVWLHVHNNTFWLNTRLYCQSLNRTAWWSSGTHDYFLLFFYIQWNNSVNRLWCMIRVRYLCVWCRSTYVSLANSIPLLLLLDCEYCVSLRARLKLSASNPWKQTLILRCVNEEDLSDGCQSFKSRFCRSSTTETKCSRIQHHHVDEFWLQSAYGIPQGTIIQMRH